MILKLYRKRFFRALYLGFNAGFDTWIFTINSKKRKVKGRGLYFNTRKGYGFIEVLSEIDENVPDRNRLLEQLKDPELGGKAGLMCSAVSSMYFCNYM